jgi:hypothetical protein
MLLIIQVTFNIYTRALSPAKVSSIKINEETKEQMFKIRRGFRIIEEGTTKLAGLLTGVCLML